MTTEDDFQRALDANPRDWQTRLVFADWLQEQGDVRAEGYRALGVLKCHSGQRRTVLPPRGRLLWFFWKKSAKKPLQHTIRKVRRSGLPDDWFNLLPTDGCTAPDYWRGYALTRCEAEDAAAHAFAKLPAERRAELLAQGT